VNLQILSKPREGSDTSTFSGLATFVRGHLKSHDYTLFLGNFLAATASKSKHKRYDILYFIYFMIIHDQRMFGLMPVFIISDITGVDV
jgi:hypothetical protein